VVESAASIGEIICRYAIFEDVYLQSPSPATDELQRALVRLYTVIMIYLSRVKSYFEQNSTGLYGISIVEYILMTSTVRRLKSGLLAKSDIESYFGAIATAHETVDRCSCMVGMQGKPARQDVYLLHPLLMNSEQINQRMDSKRLLECIDGPIERISADLENIKDGFECKLLT